MRKPNATAEERPYHHGDLQRAIVSAALEVLSETQSTEFSLRELARRAGVSHNAPYKHFADKRELLAAVSAAGFERLAKQETSSWLRGKSAASPRIARSISHPNAPLFKICICVLQTEDCLRRC